MAYLYSVSAQKPTKVTHSAVGRFTAADEANLLIAKGTRFELHLETAEGLHPVFDVPLYGRIASFQLFQPAANNGGVGAAVGKDVLLITTQRYHACVLDFDATSREVVTLAHADLTDAVARPADCGQLVAVDPSSTVVAMHLFTGLIKVIPLKANGALQQGFDVRVDEQSIVDMVFLEGYSAPTLCVLYEVNKNNVQERFIRTYELDVPHKASRDGPWRAVKCKDIASMLISIPAPLGGVLIAGEESVVYSQGTEQKSVTVTGMSPKCFGRMDKDGSRVLLSDQSGRLHVILLQHNGAAVSGVHVEPLGVTSIASSVSYLDNSVVFIGGCFGDSQLVQLNAEKDVENNTYLELLETHNNLGPIVNMSVIDLDRQGQCMLVTCSGAGKDGSLRVVRNGIGIEEQATIDLEGCRGIWSLRDTFKGEFDKYLVQSYVTDTRIFMIEDEALNEIDIEGFDDAVPTLYCATMASDTLLQVTATCVRLVGGSGRGELSRWSPPGDQRVTVATSSPTQVLLALGGGELVYLEATATSLVEKARTKMEHEVSCLALDPLPAAGATTTTATAAAAGADADADVEMTDDAEAAMPLTASLALVGLWSDISVRVLQVPSLAQVAKEELGGEIQARSVMLAQFGSKPYCLVALGDGNLFTFAVDPAQGALSDRKKVPLGTQPISLSSFKANGAFYVFAACDRPTVLYSKGDKLLFSNVNTSDVTLMCPFNTESFPDCLALASATHTTIGIVDDVQRSHIRPVHLGEQPRRIAYHSQSGCLLVCTDAVTLEKGAQVEKSYVRLVDFGSYEVVASMELEPYEVACSLTVTTFATDPDNQYAVVGTAYVFEDQEEPRKGRLLVLAISGSDTDRKLVTKCEHQINGGAMAIAAYQGMLLSSINSVVMLFSFQPSGVLVPLCHHAGAIMVIDLAVRKNFVVVADLMKSMSVLAYDPVEKKLNEVARDSSANWMTAVAALDDQLFLGADNSYNFFSVKRSIDAATEEERVRLTRWASYHLGDMVNSIQPGSLVMNLGGSSAGAAAASTPAASAAASASASASASAAASTNTGAGAGAGAGSGVTAALASTNTASASAATAAAAADTAVTAPRPAMLYGTVSGAVGVLVELHKATYELLERMQTALCKVIVPVGGLSHSEWRAFTNDYQTMPAKNIIDGDLIEMFLELDDTKMKQVVAEMNKDGEGAAVVLQDVQRLVEDMSRLH